MSKKQFEYPQQLPKKWQESYIKVTKDKVKEVMVIGRVYYNILPSGFLRGYGIIRPRLKKGQLVTDGDPLLPESFSTFIREEENLEEYHRMNLSMIGELIKNDSLYIKPNEKLVKFSYENND